MIVLSDTYLQISANRAQTARTSAQSGAKSGADFSGYLNVAAEKPRTAERQKTPNRSSSAATRERPKAESLKDVSSQQTERASKTDAKTEKASVAEKGGETAGAKSEEVGGSSKAVISEKEVNELAAEIAAALNISAEDVLSIFNGLFNGGEVDLAVLADPAAILKLVQSAYGAGSPAELLVMPHVIDSMKDVKEILERHYETAQTVSAGGDVLAEEAGLLDSLTEGLEEFAVSDDAGKGVDLREMFQQESARTTPSRDIAASVDDGVMPVAVQVAADGDDILVALDSVTTDSNTDDVTAVIQTAEAKPVVSNEPLTLTEDVSHVNAINLNSVAGVQVEEAAHVAQTAARTVNTTDVIRQITEMLKTDVRHDTTELKMTLKPETLGEVSLKISTQNGIVTAQFVAESQRIKEVIEARFSELKNSLDERGIQVSELSVSVRQENSGDRSSGGYTGERERSARRVSQIIRGGVYGAEAEADGEELNGGEVKDPTKVDIKA